MTIKAQAPAVAVGQRYTYRTPDGRLIPYEVTAVGVSHPHHQMPGYCRLAPDEPEWGVAYLTPEGLESSCGWARDQTAADEGVGRGEEPRPQSEGTGLVASPDAGQRQGEADCSRSSAEELECTRCGGEGDCWGGSDPLSDCPPELHPCHACGGSGRRSDQRIF
jgi:hypothetical protein